MELRRTLRKDGTLFVFVPAFRMLWTSLDDETKHITRFTRNTLLSALRGGGFEVTRMEYFDTLGFPACLAVRFMEALNVFRYEANSVRFYDRCVFPISHKLDGVFRHLLGKNLIAFARRA